MLIDANTNVEFPYANKGFSPIKTAQRLYVRRGEMNKFFGKHWKSRICVFDMKEEEEVEAAVWDQLEKSPTRDLLTLGKFFIFKAINNKKFNIQPFSEFSPRLFFHL